MNPLPRPTNAMRCERLFLPLALTALLCTASPAQTKTEPTKTESAKTESAKTESAKTESAKTESAKTESAKTESTKTESTKTEPAKTEPAKTEPAKTEPAKTEPTKTESEGREQLRCPKESCTTIKFDPDTIDDALSTTFGKGAGMILIDLEAWALPFQDEKLAVLNRYLHGVADRDGRVLIEPIYIGIRKSFELPLAKDVFSTGYSIATRTYALWKYRHTGDYHAKVLYHPIKRHVLYVYFIHRNFGDVCITLNSRCNVIEYTDTDTFDLILSKQLARAIEKGREVRVVFPDKKVVLPKAGLSVKAITDASEATRIYKWMAASAEVKERPMIRKRVIGLQAVTTAIDLGMAAYDLVKAYVMYKPARSMQAELQVTPVEGGRQVETIIFTPRATQQKESGCLF